MILSWGGHSRAGSRQKLNHLMGNCWRFLNHWQIKDLTFFRLAARRLHLPQINMTILTYFSNAHVGLISLHLHLNILLFVYQTGFLNFHLKWAAPIVFAKNGNSVLCQNHAWQFCSLALSSNPTVSTSKCNQILNIYHFYYVCVCAHAFSHSVLYDILGSHGLKPCRLLSPWNVPVVYSSKPSHLLPWFLK